MRGCVIIFKCLLLNTTIQFGFLAVDVVVVFNFLNTFLAANQNNVITLGNFTSKRIYACMHEWVYAIFTMYNVQIYSLRAQTHAYHGTVTHMREIHEDVECWMRLNSKCIHKYETFPHRYMYADDVYCSVVCYTLGRIDTIDDEESI